MTEIGLKPVSYTHLDVYKRQQKKYPEAIYYLKEAIKKARQKDLKARYAFIIGQLHEKNNDYAGALDFYKMAKNCLLYTSRCV